MKNYHAVATPKHSQTDETMDCYIKATSIKEAREKFKADFKNVGKVSVAKMQS